MNLNYIVQRQHIFKNRKNMNNHRVYKFKIGNTGIFSIRSQRFELIYLRGFKKVIRRAYIRRRMRFRPYKFWLFLRPNCILSCKSVNSRMGAGSGSLVRISKLLKSYQSFIEFKNYSPSVLRRLQLYTRFRYPLKYLVVTRK